MTGGGRGGLIARVRPFGGYGDRFPTSPANERRPRSERCEASGTSIGGSGSVGAELLTLHAVPPVELVPVGRLAVELVVAGVVTRDVLVTVLVDR